MYERGPKLKGEGETLEETRMRQSKDPAPQTAEEYLDYLNRDEATQKLANQYGEWAGQGAAVQTYQDALRDWYRMVWNREMPEPEPQQPQAGSVGYTTWKQ
jgi:hypothetical protein